MATPLAIVVPIPKGAWNATAVYNLLNVVTHDGRGYICKAAGSGIEPTPTGNSQWQLIADRGEAMQFDQLTQAQKDNLAQSANAAAAQAASSASEAATYAASVRSLLEQVAGSEDPGAAITAQVAANTAAIGELGTNVDKIEDEIYKYSEERENVEPSRNGTGYIATSNKIYGVGNDQYPNVFYPVDNDSDIYLDFTKIKIYQSKDYALFISTDDPANGALGTKRLLFEELAGDKASGSLGNVVKIEKGSLPAGSNYVCIVIDSVSGNYDDFAVYKVKKSSPISRLDRLEQSVGKVDECVETTKNLQDKLVGYDDVKIKSDEIIKALYNDVTKSYSFEGGIGCLNKQGNFVEIAGTTGRTTPDFIEIGESIEFDAYQAALGSYVSYCLYDNNKELVRYVQGTAYAISHYVVNKEDGVKYIKFVAPGGSETYIKTSNEIVVDGSSSSPLMGKKITFFGGSVCKLSQIYGAIDKMAEESGALIKVAAVGSAGFAAGTTITDGVPTFKVNSIPDQVNKATTTTSEKQDIYVLWASTNDLWENENGDVQNYTINDSYDVSKLVTQAGGINYCVKKIQEFAPEASIIVFGALKAFFDGSEGSEINQYGHKTFEKLEGQVSLQKEIASRHSLPFFSLWDNSGINRYNRTLYFSHDSTDDGGGTGMVTPNKDDGTHPNATAYNMLYRKILRFIEQLY